MSACGASDEHDEDPNGMVAEPASWDCTPRAWKQDTIEFELHSSVMSSRAIEG
jgi:hypothetical protein